MIELQQLTSEHLEWARQLHNDPEVLAMLTDPHVVDYYEQCGWFSNLCDSTTSKRLLVMLDNVPIGLVRLDQIDIHNNSVCVGLDIHKDFRGKGHARTIYNLVLEEYFEQRQFNRVWLMVADYNERAKHLYETLGFVLEGIQRQALFKNGQYFDYLSMSILKSEWSKTCLIFSK